MTSTRPFDAKLAIITGASRGIGLAIAHRLAAKGSNVVLGYTSPSSQASTERLASEVSSKYAIKAAAVQSDLLKASSAASQIVEAARSLFYSYSPENATFRIDFLINNAGVSSNQFLNDPEKGLVSEDEFTRVYTVNLLAPLLLMQAVAPHLPHDRSGRVINTSSVSSSIGYQGQSVYAGSKAALEAMTRTWSRELASRATVNAVNPGPAWGDMYAKAGESFWKINQPYVDACPLAEYSGEEKLPGLTGYEKEGFDNVLKEQWNGRRPGFTTEIAGTVEMLCTEAAGWTTGSVICANGGMRMSIA